MYVECSELPSGSEPFQVKRLDILEGSDNIF